MLRDQIKEVLLARILEGEYAPGQRIVELQLASEFGVSQAPVREALRELEALRLIVSEPHRGARVREVTNRELAEVYPVRAALEEEAARAAAVRLDGDVAGLEAAYAAMLDAADRDDAHGLVTADVRFHRVIVEGSGNQTLLDMWSSLHVEARTVITMVKDHPGLHEVAEMHGPLIEAFRSRDRARCGRMLRKHIEHFAKWVPREAAEEAGVRPPARSRARRAAA